MRCLYALLQHVTAARALRLSSGARRPAVRAHAHVCSLCGSGLVAVCVHE